MACEFPSIAGAPFSRWSVSELGSHVRNTGLTATLSDTTIWRWLHEDAIRPWQHRCWIFPRDPDFEQKACRLLDLYQHLWKGRKPGPDEFVLCADEKTSIQARLRKHTSLPPQPSRSMRIEHEYQRLGSWAYLAALDVHRAKIFGRCEANSGIAPFDRLVDHGPIHAGWINQIEIYFSIVQRKVLTPNDFTSLTDLSQRLRAFEHHYQAIAQPCEWRFTRQDLTTRRMATSAATSLGLREKPHRLGEVLS